MQDGHLYGRNGKKIEATSAIPKAEILEFVEADEITEIVCFCEVVYGESWGVEGCEEGKLFFVEKWQKSENRILESKRRVLFVENLGAFEAE